MIRIKVKEVSSIRVKVDASNKVVVKVKELQPVIIEAFKYPAEIDLINKKIDDLEIEGGKQIELQKSATHIQWKYTDDTEWTDLISILELKGDTGNQGDQGLKGDKGDQGIQGLKGDQGEQGIKGDTGNQGTQGLKGDEGIQGLKGDQGEQGVKGDIGNQGAQGLKGEQGIQGLKGDTGDPQTRSGIGLAATDSPEFANVLNTALNTTSQSGGEISTALWAWIASVYSGIVAKSVKSHITGIWTTLYNRDPKLLIDYTVATNVSMVTITTDSTGNALSILPSKNFKIVAELLMVHPTTGVPVDGRCLFSLNNTTTFLYRWANLLSPGFQPLSNNWYKHFIQVTGFISEKTYMSNQGTGEKVAATKGTELFPAVLDQTIADLNKVYIYSADTALYIIGMGSKIKIYRL